MSCYVVSQKQIEMIVSMCKAFESKMPYVFGYDYCVGLDIDAHNDGWEYQLADAIYQLNVESVNGRYHDNQKCEQIKWNISGHSTDVEDLELVVDLINNTMYQSCETENGANDARYRCLQQLKSFFLEKFFEKKRTSEVKWGI